jgi:glutamate N-acetyltransferase/amino-acid N-acetyltransferase
MGKNLSIIKINDSINAVQGVLCAGIKEGKYGLGIVKCRGKVAGVFTRNKLKAAPVIVTSKNISEGEIEGIIVNSGNANAFTGKKGLADALKMTQLLAERLNCKSERIAVCSTGVIGRHLDMQWIESRIDKVFSALSSSRKSASDFVRAIMTTDRFPKEYAVRVQDAVIAGVAKGAGMIAPDMATMLSFIFTDAEFNRRELQEMLEYAVSRSFNVTTVDGDTSTNDTVLLVSTGKKKVEKEVFMEALTEVCFNLAKMIARDGEGATKVFEVHVSGAKNDDDAFKAARAVANSLLVKTAIFGGDPNWGRIVAALGYSGAEIDENLTLLLETDQERITLVENGETTGMEDRGAELLRNDDFRIVIKLNKGTGRGIAIGCDLTYDYVRLNAEYTT